MIKRKEGSEFINATILKRYHNGSWRDILGIRRFENGEWKLVYAKLRASIAKYDTSESGTQVYAYSTDRTTCTITTAGVFSWRYPYTDFDTGKIKYDTAYAHNGFRVTVNNIPLGATISLTFNKNVDRIEIFTGTVSNKQVTGSTITGVFDSTNGTLAFGMQNTSGASSSSYNNYISGTAITSILVDNQPVLFS